MQKLILDIIMKGTNMQKNVVANLNPDPSPLKNELSMLACSTSSRLADADDFGEPAEEKGARILATLRLPAGRGRGRRRTTDGR